MVSTQGFKGFVRGVATDLDASDVHRLLGRDATRAYEVLTREHSETTEPRGWFRRWWYRARILFLGLSAKLAPARRLLFLFSMVVVAMAFLRENAGMNVGPISSSMLYVLGVAGLVFLLALELADRVLVRDELEVARQLQRELLPQTPPIVDGYTFAFSYRTANTIGGDYFHFLPLVDGRVAIVVGDASGHGIAAGLLMAIANATLQLALDLDADPAAVARLVNRTLYRTGGPRAFMTLWVGLLEPSSGRIDYAGSGHPYPLLCRADGELVELGAGSLPLGLRADVQPTTGSAVVERGDTLLLYTDGIPETLDAGGRCFGFDRLHEYAFPGVPAVEMHDRLKAAVESFAGEEPAHDDRSLVIVARSPDE